MENKSLFKKYHTQLVLEGLVKALALSLIAGLSGSLISAAIVLYANLSYSWMPIPVVVGLWVSFGIGFGVTFAATLILYFMFFRPGTKKIAERVDRLGLEERLITMLELEKDVSYIAMRQREDAKENLVKNRSRIKLSIFKIPLIVLGVVCLCSASMLTASAVTYKEMRPWSDPSVSEEGENKEGDLILVKYRAGKGGYILGETDQFVLFGGDATTVVAVADDGYAFAGWYIYVPSLDYEDISDDSEISEVLQLILDIAKETSDVDFDWLSYLTEDFMNSILKDGVVFDKDTLDEYINSLPENSFNGDSFGDEPESTTPERTDKNVKTKIDLIATFQKIKDRDQSESNDESKDGGEEAPDQSEPQESNSSSGDDNDGAGGNYSEINTVIDAEIYYREILQKYYDEAMKNLAGGGTISAEDRAFIELYFKIIG